LESKVEWLYSEDSKLRREARECGSFGVLNTSQPYALSRSRDAKFTSEAAERNINKEAEQEEAAEEMILSELTKRVTEHMRKQRENIVKRANSKALEYDIQEIITLQIPKQYRFGTEIARILVRVLEKTPKVYDL
jgi:hypothetical protein